MTTPATSAASGSQGQQSPAGSLSPPSRCPLCDREGRIERLSYRQFYPQEGHDPVRLTWWSCSQCRCWFVHPLPNAHQQSLHWKSVAYGDKQRKDIISRRKQPIFHKVLDELARRMPPGEMLDVGSNYGAFLELARDAGWKTHGFEPNDEAAEFTRQNGFNVRTAWSVEECGFQNGQFDVITVIDVFCYCLEPNRELHLYHRLLKPGGILVMRLTNKHAVMRAMNALPASDARDRRMSRVIWDQYHSITPEAFRDILLDVGFATVDVEQGATTAPPEEMRFKSRLFYAIADAVRLASFGRLNVSPGILLYARKAG